MISHTRFFLTSLLAWLAARIWGSPWIHIEHGSAFVTVSSRLTTFLAWCYDQTLGRLVLRQADDVVAVSQAVALFVEQLAKRSAVVIYRGLPEKQLHKARAWRPQAATNPLLLTSMGRLVSWKGFTYGVAAVQSLPPEIQHQFHYVIAGSGPSAADLRHQVSADAPILMTGALSPEHVYGLLKETTIYVHCSLPGGGLSTALLEALFCGCAVIATPHEGAAEFIKDGVTGLLVPAADSAAIASAIQSLLADPERRQRLAAAGQALVRERISWQAAGEALAKRIERLAV